ncbi:hypothetical protein [Streptomyces sp. WL006]|uniref:hypothetical protein n=1 Tax=Streptomyces sp. WL006 TaxID=3423915 RepID=UPI003F6C4D51
MIADPVSPLIGAAVSAAVQGEDWYEPTAACQSALYRLHSPGVDAERQESHERHAQLVGVR